MNLFWADEDTELAKAHIRTYQNEINELSKKYNDFDTESTYEQHMAERRRIQYRLKGVEKQYDTSSQGKSESTQDDSKGKDKIENLNQQQLWEEGLEFHPNDDMLSINSFNSSMNFAKLQNSINNQRATLKSELGSHRMDSGKMSVKTLSHEQPKTVEMDSKVPNQVKEVSDEDEQSEDNQRFSVASLVGMIKEQPTTTKQTVSNDESYYLGDNDEDSSDEEQKYKKFENLRQRAQKLKVQRQQKKVKKGSPTAGVANQSKLSYENEAEDNSLLKERSSISPPSSLAGPNTSNYIFEGENNETLGDGISMKEL